MMAPTIGLGEVSPNARRASASARRIICSSNSIEEGIGKRLGVEGLQVVRLLADADELHGNL